MFNLLSGAPRSSAKAARTARAKPSSPASLRRTNRPCLAREREQCPSVPMLLIDPSSLRRARRRKAFTHRLTLPPPTHRVGGGGGGYRRVFAPRQKGLRATARTALHGLPLPIGHRLAPRRPAAENARARRKRKGRPCARPFQIFNDRNQLPEDVGSAIGLCVFHGAFEDRVGLDRQRGVEDVAANLEPVQSWTLAHRGRPRPCRERPPTRRQLRPYCA